MRVGTKTELVYYVSTTVQSEEVAGAEEVDRKCSRFDEESTGRGRALDNRESAACR